MVRVLIIDDSSIVHVLLERAFASHGGINVIGSAFNGDDGIALINERNPDIIIMDITMPGMNGLEAIEKIMEKHPVPIIVFSAASKDIANLSFQAIERGAVDIVEKPFADDLETFKERINTVLIKKIMLFADLKVVRRHKTLPSAFLAGKSAFRMPGEKPSTHVPSEPDDQVRPSAVFPVIGIASSTGGPQTLRLLLKNLADVSINAAFVLVQHMAEGFMEGFIDWLTLCSPLPVRIPQEFQDIETNILYVAMGGRHLVFNAKGKFRFDDSPPQNGIRPSATLLFNSMAQVFRERFIAVILTGMGNDGAESLRLVKENGGLVIAQDEQTSLIFGMPKSAIATGYVDHIVPIRELHQLLAKVCHERHVPAY
jgi:two-component system chemotaxis response regulator CheB